MILILLKLQAYDFLNCSRIGLSDVSSWLAVGFSSWAAVS